LIAQKVSNGWYVEIIKASTVSMKSVVLKMARYEGLKKCKELSNDKKIYAD